MSIQENYNSRLLRGVILDLLKDGEELTPDTIEDRFNTLYSDVDTSTTRLNLDEHSVEEEERGSANKVNLTFDLIKEELSLLYEELAKQTSNSVQLIERWKQESEELEEKIQKLANEVEGLLLIAEDTEGYFSFIGDSFNDATQIDSEQTTALINLVDHSICLDPTTSGDSGATRLSLNTLNESDVTFTVLSRRYLQTSLLTPGGNPVHAFWDTTNSWQHRVYCTRGDQVVSAELKVKLPAIYNLTKISIKLNSANTNSAVQVTPMVSTDGINYSQLMLADASKSILDTASWLFPTTEVSYLKFILTKNGFDFREDQLYIYEFGAKSIALFEEGFGTDSDAGVLVSEPLFVINPTTSAAIPFSKVALDVCERVPVDTRINYAVAVSNDSVFPLTASTIWHSIDPLSRSERIYPRVISLSSSTLQEFTGVEIAYDDTVGIDAQKRNPAQTFNELTAVNTLTARTITASNYNRYGFKNSNDRLLNLQILQDLELDESSIAIWRNVGTKFDNTFVRGAPRGWGYEDPWYRTTILISNPSGKYIDFGPHSIQIDGSLKTGNTFLSSGTHRIKVHKDQWIPLPSTANDITVLKNIDIRYPYNHKYLIEGYPMSDEQNPYTGVDRFAELVMQRVSPMDLALNVATDDYSRYALDLDAGDTGTSLEPSRCFVVKVDESIAEFINERFYVSFYITGQTYTYLRLRVQLSTEDSTITPALDSYRIRLGY